MCHYFTTTIEIKLKRKAYLIFYDGNIEEKFHIHKCKWSKKLLSLTELRIELVHNMNTLTGVVTTKVKKTVDYCETLNL